MIMIERLRDMSLIIITDEAKKRKEEVNENIELNFDSYLTRFNTIYLCFVAVNQSTFVKLIL